MTKTYQEWKKENIGDKLKLEKNDIKELKKRGFDTTDMTPKPNRKFKGSFEMNLSVSLRGIWICIAIILFIIMLLFIPQCLYYMRMLEILG